MSKLTNSCNVCLVLKNVDKLTVGWLSITANWWIFSGKHSANLTMLLTTIWWPAATSYHLIKSYSTLSLKFCYNKSYSSRRPTVWNFPLRWWRECLSVLWVCVCVCVCVCKGGGVGGGGGGVKVKSSSVLKEGLRKIALKMWRMDLSYLRLSYLEKINTLW